MTTRRPAAAPPPGTTPRAVRPASRPPPAVPRSPGGAPAQPPRPGRERCRLHQLAEPPGPFAATCGGLRHDTVAFHARIALVRGLDGDRRDALRGSGGFLALAVGPYGLRGPHVVDGHTRPRPDRHPRGQRRTGQGGQQFRRRRPDVAAAVGQGLLHERLVVRAQARAQGVEEHQPVLGPFRRPCRREQVACGGRFAGAQCGEQGDPFGEQALLPELLDSLVVLEAWQGRSAARGRAQGEPPVRVQPGQPQGTWPRELQRRRPQIGTAPGGVQQRGECLRRRCEPTGVRHREPLRQQLRQIGRGTPPTAAGRARAVGQQHREPAGGRRGQGRTRVLRSRLWTLRRPRRAQTGPSAYGLHGRRVQQGRGRVRTRRRTRRGAPVGAQQRGGDEPLPDVRAGRVHRSGGPGHELPFRGAPGG